MSEGSAGSGAAALALADMRAGRGEWRNISAVVRLTMAALLETTGRLARGEGEVRARLGEAPSHADLADAVGGRASAEELRVLAQTLREESSRRSDAVFSRLRPLEAFAEESRARVGRLEEVVREQGAEIARLREMLSQRPTLAEAEALFAPQTAMDAKADVEEVNAALARKVGRETVEHALRAKADRADLDSLGRQVQDRATRAEVVEFCQQGLRDAKETATEAKQAAAAARSLAEEAQHRAKLCVTNEELEGSLRKRCVTPAFLDRRVERLSSTLATEAERAIKRAAEDLERAVSRKASRGEVSKALAGKMDLEEAKGLLAGKADVGAVVEALRRKADASEVAALRVSVAESGASGGGVGGAEDLRGDVARIEATLGDFARGEALVRVEERVKAHAEAIDKKITELCGKFTTVEQGLERVQEETEREQGASKLAKSASELATRAAETTTEISAIFSTMPKPLMGRWVWRSRALHEDNVIPWDVESLNTTLPTTTSSSSSSSSSTPLLGWREGSGVVVCARPGLYRVALGVFASRTPTVTILVNGAPAVTSDPSGAESGAGAGASVVIHKHPAGSVAGLSLVQFLALPADAHVSVLYDGVIKGQGFLELRKI